jgi:hypothetical protein
VTDDVNKDGLYHAFEKLGLFSAVKEENQG